MFFLLRCVFWLGLVFLGMDWGSRTVLPTREEIAQEAASRCLADPQVCASLVAQAQRFSTASIFDSAASAKPSQKVSADSLSASDRSPAWKGPKP